MPLVKLIDVAIPRNRSVKTFSGERVYIATGDLLGNQINLDSAEIVDFENKPSRASQETNPGDVIFAKMQATDKSIVINEDNMKHIYSSGFYILEPTTSILSQYLYHFLRSSSFHKQKDKNCSGATQKAITLEWLQNIKIPLPSLEEQKVIIAKLDKLIELIDLKKEAIWKTEQLTKSVFLEIFGDPVMNEKWWRKMPLWECVIKIESWYSPICDSRKSKENEWWVLKLSAVTGWVFRESENKFLSISTPIKKILEVNNDDLLLTRKNTKELVGDCCYVFHTRSKLIIPDTIFRFILHDSIIDKMYLWQLITNKKFSKNIRNLASWSAGSMPNISKEKLKWLLIPVPDRNLQRKFVLFSKENQFTIENQKQSLQKLQELYNTTTQEIFNFL